ncbi:MAG: LysR family transcriptional regulator [Burkholderiaceae bacterium]
MARDPFRLPPLDLLATFEAAARLLSFTAAGEERSITQSAVSRQIRALEDDLGVALFQRAHRSLHLTDAGRQLHRTCREVLDQLREAAGRLRSPAARSVVTLTTLPGLASLWLVPRLSRLMHLQPDIDVRIDVSFAARDLEADGIDLAVRYLKVDRAQGRQLFEELVVPVCSPKLLASTPQTAFAAPAQALGSAVLLSLIDGADRIALIDWEPWLRSMDIPDPQPRRVMSFSSYDDVVRAAILGQGIALGRRPIVDELLASGKLVPAFGGREADAVSSACAYFLIVNPRSRVPTATAAVAEWLSREAEETRADDRSDGRNRPGTGVATGQRRQS